MDERLAKRWRDARRTILAACKAMHEESLVDVSADLGWSPKLITMTYRPDVEWSGRQISKCMRLLDDYLEQRGFIARYCWKLELHKSGRPHYHVVVWWPRGRPMPFLDKVGWWPHGNTKLSPSLHRPVQYLAKYCAKTVAGVLPYKARLFGFGGLSARARGELRWTTAPGWLREFWEKAPIERSGPYWINRDNGFAIRSPWQLASSWSSEQFEYVGWLPSPRDIQFVGDGFPEVIDNL